eukprot:TRINITY_DN3773_c0_g1_i14.p1 TRINITY_DN3773_c0_g1~~TRINITY_DN3773_c0_g1_i14.p1  ORF type:complete len:110 (+),score=18.96 TRINITY_DN3773_c0_g1_i14:4879-5208(+)
MVLKSIGYKSVPVNGLPFDHQKGGVPNIQGRVLSDKSEHAILEKGLYVTGWLKRGPTGIIGTNLFCAEETVSSPCEPHSSHCNSLGHGFKNQLSCAILLICFIFFKKPI